VRARLPRDARSSPPAKGPAERLGFLAFCMSQQVLHTIWQPVAIPHTVEIKHAVVFFYGLLLVRLLCNTGLTNLNAGLVLDQKFWRNLTTGW